MENRNNRNDYQRLLFPPQQTTAPQHPVNNATAAAKRLNQTHNLGLQAPTPNPKIHSDNIKIK